MASQASRPALQARMTARPRTQPAPRPPEGQPGPRGTAQKAMPVRCSPAAHLPQEYLPYRRRARASTERPKRPRGPAAAARWSLPSPGPETAFRPARPAQHWVVSPAFRGAAPQPGAVPCGPAPRQPRWQPGGQRWTRAPAAAGRQREADCRFRRSADAAPALRRAAAADRPPAAAETDAAAGHRPAKARCGNRSARQAVRGPAD